MRLKLAQIFQIYAWKRVMYGAQKAEDRRKGNVDAGTERKSVQECKQFLRHIAKLYYNIKKSKSTIGVLFEVIYLNTYHAK